MDPAVSLLIKARAVIEDESAWTQGVLARSKYNRVIGPKAPGACRFCAFGALAHVSEENGPDNPIWRRATDLLDAAAIQIAPDLATGDTKSLRPAVYINDEGEHADVLRMYDLAIAPFGVDALKLSAPPSPSPAGEKSGLSPVGCREGVMSKAQEIEKLRELAGKAEGEEWRERRARYLAEREELQQRIAAGDQT